VTYQKGRMSKVKEQIRLVQSSKRVDREEFCGQWCRRLLRDQEGQGQTVSLVDGQKEIILYSKKGCLCGMKFSVSRLEARNG